MGIGSRHAIPLWIPYPNVNLSAHLRPKHCSVGDVGILRHDGSFEVVFNALMSRAENEEMHYKITPSFQPLVLQVERVPLVSQSTSYMTNNLVRCNEEEIGFQTILVKGKHQTAASILVLPDNAIVERLSDLNIRLIIDEYVAQHCVSWYELLNGTDTGARRRFPNGTLKMIGACYKAKVWSAASIPLLSEEEAASNLKAKLLKHSSSESENSIYTWEANHTFNTNRGSSNPKMNYHSEYSVAVELYTIKKRKPKSTSSGTLLLSSFTSSGIQGSMESQE
ncbi:hypothetical protein JR316_0004006 [Psilocybe cubensis]|uniref:Uncharacterized protein n=1 Tax=Psilocybe cubensis TaxID=181762 RepID=A0ACB8H9M5_PSICU|nr:hypothetical protein JR316_0004006 [Psilocybe cubensis]KAH9484524.1 hypothetical protein JR316_0004006 [Psilocybe cubensis]